jgi:DNA-binding PadR family transcriptional regulator
MVHNASRLDASMPDVKAFLPLTPQQFHILLALTDGHRHGYGIIQDIADRTGGAIRPGTGTLYTALARLEALALVEESLRRPRAADDDERRRYYRLTILGRSVLQAETERLDTLVRHARRKGIAATTRLAWSRSK